MFYSKFLSTEKGKRNCFIMLYLLGHEHEHGDMGFDRIGLDRIGSDQDFYSINIIIHPSIHPSIIHSFIFFFLDLDFLFFLSLGFAS